MTGAVTPERLAPVRGTAEGLLVACFVSGQRLAFVCTRVKRGRRYFLDGVNKRLTAEVAPTAAQPVATLGIHNRSACIPHSCRCRRTLRKRRGRTIVRAVAEPKLTRIHAAVEVLALDVVLGAAVAVGTTAAIEISRYVGTGWDASAGTRDAAYGVAADVDIGDGGDVGGGGD